MLFEAILREVDDLQDVSTRLERLAEQHPPMSEALVTQETLGTLPGYWRCWRRLEAPSRSEYSKESVAA